MPASCTILTGQEACGPGRADQVGQRRIFARPRRAPPPGETERAARLRLGEADKAQAPVAEDAGVDGEPGQEGDALAGSDELEDGGKAGRAEAAQAARIDRAADRKRLIAEAVAVLEKEQLIGRDSLGERRRTPRMRRIRRGGQKKDIVEGRRLVELVGAERQARDDRVEVAGGELDGERAGYRFADGELQPRVPSGGRGDQARQEEWRHRRNDAEAKATRENFPTGRGQLLEVVDRGENLSSPPGNLDTKLGQVAPAGPRSTSTPPRAASSSRICIESAGWVTPTASAARPKWPVAAKAFK